MESWFQRLFLMAKMTSLAFAVSHSPLISAQANDSDKKTPDAHNIDSEYFETGVFIGTLNIEDFTSEVVLGVNATFNADENFFLQLNYLQADTSPSSFEESQGKIFSGDDRIFSHFDFLVGYNILQGEHFFSGTKAKLSSFYLVAGIGDTDFGGESSFTYTIGLGYQVNLTRDILLRVDYRDYIFKTNLLGDGQFTHNTQLSAGVSYLF